MDQNPLPSRCHFHTIRRASAISGVPWTQQKLFYRKTAPKHDRNARHRTAVVFARVLRMVRAFYAPFCIFFSFCVDRLKMAMTPLRPGMLNSGSMKVCCFWVSAEGCRSRKFYPKKTNTFLKIHQKSTQIAVESNTLWIELTGFTPWGRYTYINRSWHQWISLSRPQAQLSRSTFALHYVWFLGCPVTRKSRSSMLVDMVRGCGSGPRCSPSVWEVAKVCCEGFWRDFGCHPIGWSSDGSMKKVDIAKITDIADIGQNHDTSWISRFFLVLSAINHSKPFVCSFRFVRNIVYIVWDTTLGVKLEKHTESSAKSTQKRIQITVLRDSCSALPVLGNL